jgi:hypothetical protein
VRCGIDLRINSLRTARFCSWAANLWGPEGTKPEFPCIARSGLRALAQPHETDWPAASDLNRIGTANLAHPQRLALLPGLFGVLNLFGETAIGLFPTDSFFGQSLALKQPALGDLDSAHVAADRLAG